MDPNKKPSSTDSPQRRYEKLKFAQSLRHTADHISSLNADNRIHSIQDLILQLRIYADTLEQEALHGSLPSEAD